MTVAERISALGLTLPQVAAPVGSYAPASLLGNVLFLSGHICRRNGTVVPGKVGHGERHDKAHGAELAKLCALELLATIDAAVGLDQVRRIVKVTGFVNCTPDFTELPTVINGASDLFVAVFGPEIGVHARSAIGAASLPLDAAVEIEAIVEVAV